MRKILYHKEVPILEYELYPGPFLETTKILNSELAPKQLLYKEGAMLQTWMTSRGLDMSIPKHRELLRSLDLATQLDAVLYANAMCMSDHYWTNISVTDYSEHIRVTGVDVLSIAALTSIGSFEKRWVKNIMYKKGTTLNNMAEIWNSQLCELLELPTAKYFLDGNEVITFNFTNDTNFLEHFESYRFIDLGKTDSELLGKEYRDICTVDAITSNPDRHYSNFGVLRSADTGKVMSVAPNYDNNLGWGASQKMSTAMLKQQWDNLSIDALQRFADLSLSFHDFPRELYEVQKYVRERLSNN